MNWIFPCNPKKFNIHKAFRECSRLDWRMSRYSVRKGDFVFIYVSEPEAAIRYKCRVVEADKKNTSFDETIYGGDKAWASGRWMELELVQVFPEPGITLEDLRDSGLDPKCTMQSAVKIPDDGMMAQLISYWEIGAFPRNENKEKPALNKTNMKTEIPDYSMSEQDRIFFESCDTYNPDLSYEEYVVNIFRCLMLSSWHYSPEYAVKLIGENNDLILKAFMDKEPVNAIMVEIGFGCG